MNGDHDDRASRHNRYYPSEDSNSIERYGVKQRPSKILYYWLRRLVKRGEAASMADAVAATASTTTIPPNRIHAISGGAMPTSLEIDRFCATLGWGIFFLFGISEAAVDRRSRWYFTEMEIEIPTIEQKREFERLYTELITPQVKDDDGGAV